MTGTVGDRGGEPPLLPGWRLDGRVMLGPERDGAFRRRMALNARLSALAGDRAAADGAGAARAALVERLNARLAEAAADIEDGRADLLEASLGGALRLVDALDGELARIERWIGEVARQQGVDPARGARVVEGGRVWPEGEAPC